MTDLDGLGLTHRPLPGGRDFKLRGGVWPCAWRRRKTPKADDVVDEVREKTRELEKLLDDFSERLRRMRQRNRQVQDDISSFEGDLERLRSWLAEHT